LNRKSAGKSYPGAGLQEKGRLKKKDWSVEERLVSGDGGKRMRGRPPPPPKPHRLTSVKKRRKDTRERIREGKGVTFA